MSEHALTPVRRLWVRERFGRGRKQRNAALWLDAFELEVCKSDYRRTATLALMAHEADNDGRGTVQTRGLVNGTETRFSERWLIPSDPTEDYETVWTIAPDGTRKPFTAHLTDAQNAPTQARKPLTDNELDALDAALRTAEARRKLGTQADID
jgi:hypothetical protein